MGSSLTKKEISLEAKRLLALIDKDNVTRDKDIELINQIQLQLNTFGDVANISERQLFWLRDIKDRLL